MESVTQGGRSVQAGPISHGSPAALLPPQGRGRESGACSRAVLGARRVGTWRCWPITLSWPTGTGAVHCSCV